MAATSIILPWVADEVSVETVYKAGKYLTFRVARQDFAMDAECVRGILPMHQMAALDTVHPWISGFAAIGGRDFPVVDLRAKLAMAHGTHGREPMIVAVEWNGQLAGFIADRVTDILNLRARDFHNGIVRMHGRPRRVLDPAQIMKEDDWSTLRIHVAE